MIEHYYYQICWPRWWKKCDEKKKNNVKSHIAIPISSILAMLLLLDTRHPAFLYHGSHQAHQSRRRHRRVPPRGQSNIQTRGPDDHNKHHPDTGKKN